MCPKILMRRCLYREGELRTWVPDRPDKSNPLGVALANGDVPSFIRYCFESTRCSHSLDTTKQKRQGEGDTRPTGDEHGSIAVYEIRRLAIWTVNKHLDLLALLSSTTRFPGESTVDVDEKHEFLPVGLGLTERLLFGYRGNVTLDFITRGINTGDGEGVSFERDGGNAGHDQVSGLTRRPVEMRGPA